MPTLATVLKQIKIERDGMCTGCETTKHLSPSHLVRVGKNKALETNKLNITYHCLSIGKTGCHDLWESCEYGHMLQLIDFHRSMAICFLLEPQFYHFLVNRFKEQGYDYEIDKSKINPFNCDFTGIPKIEL